LAGLGLVCFWRDTLGDKLRRTVAWTRKRFKRSAVDAPKDEATLSVFERREARFATMSLWGLCIVLSYAPWWFDKTPIFGGTKHWITAYPYFCMFAAVALDRALALFGTWASSLTRPIAPRLSTAGKWAVAIFVTAPTVVMGLDVHPWGLTAYTPLVGGAPGAASLGLNRSFWGYTTLAVAEPMNEAARSGKKRPRVFVHDTAIPSFNMMVSDGSLDSKLRPSGAVNSSNFALYHHEQHMSRVEFMIWVDYKTTAPVAVGDHDGVPVVWLYER
jgi:hypothetical protein